jgi:hypothetical protein
VRHGAGDERRPDDVEEELELRVGGGGPAGGGAVERLDLEPGAHVSAARAAALVGAGRVDEHLIGDGHLQHGVQGVVAVQVRAQLPHDTTTSSRINAGDPIEEPRTSVWAGRQSYASACAGDRGRERNEEREKGRPGTRTCRRWRHARGEEYVDRANNGGRVEELVFERAPPRGERGNYAQCLRRAGFRQPNEPDQRISFLVKYTDSYFDLAIVLIRLKNTVTKVSPWCRYGHCLDNQLNIRIPVTCDHESFSM